MTHDETPAPPPPDAAGDPAGAVNGPPDSRPEAPAAADRPTIADGSVGSAVPGKSSAGSIAVEAPPPAAAGAAPPAVPDLDLFGNAPRGRPDWSHRRGEPRVFALLWTVFLTVLATTTLMRAAIGGRLDVNAYRESLRMMLMIVATAIAVAWPLLRLSQARPRGGGLGSIFKDVLILLVPLQAVLWPQAILAHWPALVIAGLDALMAAWALMVGGVVALTLGPGTEDPQGLPDAEVSRPDAAGGRMAAMAVVIGLGAIGGACAFVLDAALRPDRSAFEPGAWWMMLSPHTAIAEITRERSEFGESARVESAHLWTLAVQGAVGLALWLIAGLRQALAPSVATRRGAGAAGASAGRRSSELARDQ